MRKKVRIVRYYLHFSVRIAVLFFRIVTICCFFLAIASLYLTIQTV